MIFECKNPDGAGIYKIENIKNGNCYIGCTTNFERRYQQHYQRILNNNHSNISKKEIKKYKVNNFKFSVIEEVEYKFINKINFTKLLKLEADYIFKLQPFYNNTGKVKKIKIGNKIKIFQSAQKYNQYKKYIESKKINNIPSGYINLVRLKDGTIKKLGCNSSYNNILHVI